MLWRQRQWRFWCGVSLFSCVIHVGDLWIVEVSDKGKWTRTSQVRFRHVDTGMYLYASTKAKVSKQQTFC